MRNILAFLIFFIAINAHCQQKWIDKPRGGNIYYGKEMTENIASINDLPKNIQSNLNGYIRRILPTMADSISFSHGQIVDLEKYFKENPMTYDSDWIRPKYEFNFYLKNKNMGIKNYNLEIKMDQYGQILEANWPRENKTDVFRNLAEVEDFALLKAKLKGYETAGYKIDLRYNDEFDKLFYTFFFPTSYSKYKNDYIVFEIPWDELEIFKEYRSSILTLH